MPNQKNIELGVPWSLQPTPEVLDDMVIEHDDVAETGYKRLPMMTPHPDRDKYAGFLLVDEQPDGQFQVKRIWSNAPVNQDLYNYDLGYSGESNSHRIYSRRYLYRRDAYEADGPLPKGANLTGVWMVRVTNGGTNYNPALPPAVALSGGSGAGATAEAFVDGGGVIRWIRVKSEGTGYLSVPAVTIDPPNGGVTATGVAVIQQSFTQIVASVMVNSGGSAYFLKPTITFNSGSATAEAQVTAGGVLAGIVVTNAGRDYVLAPGVTITEQVTGSGATATAVLEEARLSCVKEDCSELPTDDPRQSLFVLVTRVFETTPGPVLRDIVWDWKLKTNVFVQKRIVLSSSVPLNALASPTVAAGTRTEYQSTPNCNRSVQIISSIGSDAPSSYQFFSRVNYRFPDFLEPTPEVWIAFVANNLRPSGLEIDQALGIVYDITEGYAGPCKAKITRHFTFTPTEAFLDALPVPVAFQPQAHVVTTAFTYGSATQTIAKIQSFGIPQTIHPAYTFVVMPVFPGSGTFYPITIPATTPPAIPTGYICIDINPTLDERFGLWVYDVVEIKHP